MFKLKKACYYHNFLDAILRPCFWRWLILITDAWKTDGLIFQDGNARENLVVPKFLIKSTDIDLMIHVLLGDNFFDQNKRDVAALEKEAGRAVIELWDTDPIFARYPHLRGLARNMEFEKMWEKIKQKAK